MARASEPTCRVTPTDRLDVPAWAVALLGPQPLHHERNRGGIRRAVCTGNGFALLTATVPAAAGLGALDLQRATVAAYAAIRAALADSGSPWPVRFWNFIPFIGRPVGDGLDRYMIFNAGRFAAYLDWYGGTDAFDQLVATASGVGHCGDDLVVACLAAPDRGIAVENPRQISAYRYSTRYGPLPPSFARATICPLAPRAGGNGAPAHLVLVGGTASIRGEQSAHRGDAVGQARETLDNLAALVSTASRRIAGGDGAAADHHGDSARWLATFRSVRIYHVRPNDRAPLAALLTGAFPRAEVEWLRADLCRRELLVEIEGAAEVTVEADGAAHPGTTGSRGLAAIG